MKKTCKKCGDLFLTNYPSKSYCSNLCYIEAQKPLRRARNKRINSPKKCISCGIEFTPLRSDKNFCTKECGQKFRNDRVVRKTSRSASKAKLMKQIPIPSLEQEIILGTIMGDSSTSLQTDGFYYIKMAHCAKQKDYLMFKASLLPSIFNKIDPWERLDSLRIIQGNAVSERKTSFGTSSISHPDITPIRDLMYVNGTKSITESLLDKLTPTSLLFWYLDDGSINFNRRYSQLSTNCFSENEVILLKSFLLNKYNIEASHHFSTVRFEGKVFQYPILKFTVKGTIDFHNLLKTSPIFPLLPECVLYKFKTSPYKQKSKLS